MKGNKMIKTIERINKQNNVLVDVIQWLDEKNFSNSEIRSQVDSVLNHEGRRIKEKSDMELTKIKFISPKYAYVKNAR